MLKVALASWLDAEVTDPTAVCRSRTGGSCSFLLAGSPIKSCCSFWLPVGRAGGGPAAPSSAMVLVRTLLVSGERPVAPLASLWTVHEARCFLGQFMGSSLTVNLTSPW